MASRSAEMVARAHSLACEIKAAGHGMVLTSACLLELATAQLDNRDALDALDQARDIVRQRLQKATHHHG